MHSRHSQEELYWKWKQSDRSEDLSELIQSFDPMIKNKVFQLGSTAVPNSAVEAEAKKEAIQAFKTWDSDKAGLSTHVGNRLQKVDRYVMDRQSAGRMPEQHILQMGQFREAEDRLKEEKGRDATMDELADHLKWTPGHVSKIRRSSQGSVNISIDPSLEEVNPNYGGDFAMDVSMKYVYRDLSPQEQKVFDHTFGWNGESEKKTNKDIAMAMGVSESLVRKVKGKIYNQMKPFVG
jgi:DNA-directed RNA polymerase specialized sigma subunit